MSKTEVFHSIYTHLVRVALLNEIEQKLNYGMRNTADLWEEINKKLRNGEISSIFDFLKIPDNAENRFKIILAKMKYFVKENSWLTNSSVDLPKDMPSLIGLTIKFSNLVVELENMLNGVTKVTNNGKDHILWQRPIHSPKELTKHLFRCAFQVLAILEKIENEEVVEELKWSFPAAWLHDIARFISHGSDHDDWGDRLFSEVNIREKIINAKHKPIPIEGSASNFNPQEFDSPAQGLSRLVDIGGKIDLETGLLRESVDELVGFSMRVQLEYFKKGDPVWAKTEEPKKAIENYTLKEAKALNHTIKYLESIGVDWHNIVKKINQNSTENPLFSQYAK